ncbi:hypothetical protein BZG36_03994 [Bifiguratus adelaidae]|uniref:Uncharacterized protein n=1 Tax=Bifiguratus adelaidae TaxID=1938954 RepID=A0A261Y1N0_9FUNG|nr:hypothetical protein BZG36_03994 [Bifiguratus adelaidae]
MALIEELEDSPTQTPQATSEVDKITSRVENVTLSDRQDDGPSRTTESDEEVEFQDAPSHSEEEMARQKAQVEEANQRKAQGNTLFAQGRYRDAILEYESALGSLPAEADEVETDAEQEKADGQKVHVPFAQERAVYWGNLGACYLKLVIVPIGTHNPPYSKRLQEDYPQAVSACNSALKYVPSYTKALYRRAQASEKLGTSAGLTDALEDYKKVVAVDDTSKSADSMHLVTPVTRRECQKAIQRLPAQIQAKAEHEKEEMLAKLKEMGNTILGKFGLSTDNFKMVPQEGGGYSLNFTR